MDSQRGFQGHFKKRVKEKIAQNELLRFTM